MRKSTARTTGLLLAACAIASLAGQAAAPKAPSDLEVLTKALARPLAALQGRMPTVAVTLDGRYRHDGREESVRLAIASAGGGRYGLELKSRPFTFTLVRDAQAFHLLVPSRKVAVVGAGAAEPEAEMAPRQLLASVSAALPPEAKSIFALLSTAEPGAVALLLQSFLQLERVPAPAGAPGVAVFTAKKPAGKGTLSIEVAPDGSSVQALRWHGQGDEASLSIAIRDKATLPPTATDGLQVLRVPRGELERMLGRALPRAIDVLHYNHAGPLPRDEVRTAGRGRLVVKHGARLCTLEGSPYEIGFQHGRLLKGEMGHLMDSVLCAVGIAYTLEKRAWFPDVMRGAFKRLEPHIPEEYLEEMKGLADGASVPLETVQLASVFPALFHCSGFAVMGKATQGGKLYHGRVLDYMTEVGLQREAVVFVVKKRGAIPFANVGYAGFIGCVSGMNAQRVALGEMGGGGEGLWDGTPMPILMRMGLERAKSLNQVCDIFRKAKRTCEYYYVFSDGKIPDAVGVGATPDKIEFIRPGQPHPKLPTPVADCVLLSAGSRYKHLVRKVQAGFGHIDKDAALDLMRRPVAMRSNLHDVLFVPQDLTFYVANARGSKPACDQPYTPYNLRTILTQMAHPTTTK